MSVPTLTDVDIIGLELVAEASKYLPVPLKEISLVDVHMSIKVTVNYTTFLVFTAAAASTSFSVTI